MDRKFVFDIIEQECERQKTKWGEQNHDPFVWLAILTEEVGEAAQAILEQDWDQMRAELIQCAAVIISWLSSNSRKETHPTPTLKIGDAVKINNYNCPPDYGTVLSEATMQSVAGSSYVFYLVECAAFEDGSRHFVPASRLTLVEEQR